MSNSGGERRYGRYSGDELRTTILTFILNYSGLPRVQREYKLEIMGRVKEAERTAFARSRHNIVEYLRAIADIATGAWICAQKRIAIDLGEEFVEPDKRQRLQQVTNVFSQLVAQICPDEMSTAVSKTADEEAKEAMAEEKKRGPEKVVVEKVVKYCEDSQQKLVELKRLIQEAMSATGHGKKLVLLTIMTEQQIRAMNSSSIQAAFTARIRELNQIHFNLGIMIRYICFYTECVFMFHYVYGFLIK